MRTFGKTLFWIGFVMTAGIVLAYLILMLCGAFVFTGWVSTVSLCGIVIIGSILMLVGRAQERKDDAYNNTYNRRR